MKKKIIFLSIFIFLLAIGGVVAFYITKTNQKPIVYGKGEVAKYKTDTRPVPTDGTTPLDYDSYANMAYILWLLEHTEQYSSLTEGTAVSVGQKQVIYNHRRVNGKEQLVDTISSGLISLGKQKYFKDGKVLIRDYISKNGDVIEWKTEEPECISNSQYIVRYGWLPTQATAYIICKETILEISELNSLEDGTYSIQLSLNPDRDYAPFWYQREVATNASSLDEAKFSSIHLEFIFDRTWRVLKVNTQENYKVTPKVAPISVSCDTNIVETFTYEKPDFGSALDYFEQYKDLKPSDGEVLPPAEENTPLSYITGSLLGGDSKEHFFKVNIKINDKVLEGKLSLDISDLNDISVKVSIGDLQVIYSSKMVYIDYHSLKLKCNVEEAFTIIQPLLEELMYGENPSDFTSSFDLNQIMADINAATMLETEDHVTLDVLMNLLGIQLPLQFDIEKNGDNLDLISIKSKLELMHTEITFDIVKQENLTFQPIEGDYNDLKMIDFLIEDVTQILRNKKFSLDFHANYQEYNFDGKLFVSTQKNDPIQMDLTISNPQKNILEELSIFYAKETIYLTYKDNHLKLTLATFQEFLKKQGIELPEIQEKDIIKILKAFENIELSTILKSLVLTEGKIEIELDLSNLNEQLTSIVASINHTEKGFTISSNLMDLSMDFDILTDFKIEIEEEKYVALDGYLAVMDYLSQRIGKKSMGFDLNGVFMINEMPIQVASSFKMYLVQQDYEVEGDIRFNINGNLVLVHMIYQDNYIYLRAYGYTLRLDVAQFSVTLNKVLEAMDLEPIEMSSIEITSILQLLSKLKVGEAWIEVDLTTLSTILGKVLLSFAINEDKLNLELSSDFAKLNLELKEIEAKAITTPTEYYTEEEILRLLPYVKNIKQIVEQKHVQLQGKMTYEGAGIDFNLYVDFTNSIEAMGKLHIEYQEEVFDIDVIYKNSNIYLEYKNIKLKVERDRLLKYLPKLELKPMGIEELLTYLKEFRIEDQGIKIVLGKEDVLEFYLKETSLGFEVTTNLYESTIQVDTVTTKEIKIEENLYTNVSGYLDILDYVVENLGQQSFGIDVDATLILEDKPLHIFGQINIYSKEEYSFEGALTVSYTDYAIDLQLTGTQKEVYVHFLEYTILLNLETLPSTLQLILKELGIEYSLDLGWNWKDALYILDSLEIQENKIICNLDKLGQMGIMLTKGQDQLSIFIQTSLFEFSAYIHSIEYKDITTPTEYYTEEEILRLLPYVKNIKQIVEQKHVQLQGKMTYEGVGIDFNLYVDFTNSIEAMGKLYIEYQEEVFDIDVIYKNSIIYLEYKNIKLKVERDRLLKYLPKLELKPMGIEELLTYLKEFRIEEQGIKIVLGKEDVLEFYLKETSLGFEVTTNLYESTIQVDTVTTKEIKIEENLYTNVSGYLDILDYVVENLGQQSFGIDVDATLILEDKPLQLTGFIDCLFENDSYLFIANLRVVYADITLDVELIYQNQKLYVTIYDNVIELSTTDIQELISYIETKFNMTLPMPTFSDLVKLLEHCSLDEVGIGIDLSSLVSVLSNVRIDLSLTDTLKVMFYQQGLFTIQMTQCPVHVNAVPEVQPTLNKEDILQILDQISYVMDLVSSKGIHFDIEDALVQVKLNDKREEIKVSGSMDLLIKESGIEVIGHFTLQGLNSIIDVDLIYVENIIYVTIANQTIRLELDQIHDFLLEAKKILEPILNLNVTLPEINLEMDLAQLKPILSSSSLNVELSAILEKVCELSILFGILENRLETEVIGTYDEIFFQVPVSISKSTLEKIDLPTSYLSMDDLLVLLQFVVDGYNLMQEKEFNLNLSTSLYTNGDLVATIQGELYLKIYGNNSFDARFKAIIQQYEKNEATQWHQLDLQIISLHTLKQMNSDLTTAMIYGLYGNNPMDTSAVIKIKSTYTGIESLFEVITKLMNISLPSLEATESTIFDLRNILNMISVTEDEVRIQIFVNALFKDIQHEIMEVILTKQNEQLSSIEVSNIYLSYTNSKKYTKLDTLKISMAAHTLDVQIPEDADNYYDISNIANLFEAFYNNALEKSFEISGTVTLTALSIVNINMPIQLKINVDESGMPILYLHMDMTNIGLGSLMMSKKHVYIYYKDEYVYIYRDDNKDKDDRKIKVHYTEFLSNIMYYLMDYAMGLPDSILSLINKTPEGDGFVDAAGCINDLSIGTDEFMFNLNMKELADNYDLGKLVISLASTLVAKTDEQGNYILDAEGNIVYAPMIYRIPNFEFVAVDVINLNSKNLILSNIKEDSNGNLIVYDIELSELEAYLEEFDSLYNADEEYIYSDGAWISNGKIKHNVVFDLEDAGNIVKRYSESTKIDFPYEKNSVFSVSTDLGMKYYKVVGWYLDASYKTPIENISSIYMGNKSLTYYAKVVDVTIQLTIRSSFDEDFILTTYEGADISSRLEEKYSIKNLNQEIYRFMGLKDEQGNSINLSTLKKGEYTLSVLWEKVEYAFYVVCDTMEAELDQTSDVPFLQKDYAVFKNQNYLIYAADKLTPEYILSTFAGLFIFNEDLQRFELQLISLEDVILKDYTPITFAVAREEFDTKGYYGFYIPKDTSTDISGLLPNGTWDSFEINAWISNGVYYSLSDIKQIRGEYHFEAYISTMLSNFEFETMATGATITEYIGTSSTLIFPEYAFIGGVYLPVVEIKEQIDDAKDSYSAFTANTMITTLVFNESLSLIPANAFKNCDSLTQVYFPKALVASNVKSNAFYFVKTGAFNFEKALEVASKISFYCSEVQANEFDLVACRYNNSDRHYGKKESGFLGAGSADLRNSFVKKDLCIAEISNEIIKNL